MFQAVVGDHGGESAGRERQFRCVALHKIRDRRTRSIQIRPKSHDWITADFEASASATQIENTGPFRKMSQNFMHDSCAAASNALS
jgi:hypothetical protein